MVCSSSCWLLVNLIFDTDFLCCLLTWDHPSPWESASWKLIQKAPSNCKSGLCSSRCNRLQHPRPFVYSALRFKCVNAVGDQVQTIHPIIFCFPFNFRTRTPTATGAVLGGLVFNWVQFKYLSLFYWAVLIQFSRTSLLASPLILNFLTL